VTVTIEDPVRALALTSFRVPLGIMSKVTTVAFGAGEAVAAMGGSGANELSVIGVA
jgi:hypothetical protein